MVITVIMDAALEKTLRIPGFAPGTDCRAEGVTLQPGGRALRTAMAVHGLGGRVAAVGVAGGAEGEYIRDRLDRMGMPNDLAMGRAETPDELRLSDGNCVTRIRETAPAASERELLEVWRKVSDLAGPGDVVLFAGELPESLTPEMLEGWIGELRREGAVTVLDVEGVRRFAAAKPSLLIAGPAELAGLRGARLEGQEELVEAAKQVAGEGTDAVVVPQEDGKVLFVREDETRWVQISRDASDEAVTARVVMGLAPGGSWRELAARVVDALSNS